VTLRVLTGIGIGIGVGVGIGIGMAICTAAIVLLRVVCAGEARVIVGSGQWLVLKLRTAGALRPCVRGSVGDGFARHA